MNYAGRVCLLFLVVLTGLSLMSQPAAAQILYGSLVGNVKDPSDAAIGGATVVATHKETNQARQTASNEVGSFSFPTMQAGVYEIRVTKDGFRTATSEVTVTINSVTRADLTLQLGAVAESVQVTAAAASLQTDRSEVRAEMGSKTFQNLPVPLGRNYQSLLRTIPGFRPPSNAHSVPTNPSRALTYKRQRRQL
ncbi:MAG: carboxypeptidase regulatory-like domain-containing protein [Acidobacteria bacterium]|nr:carboxypeptidase regulatory-like domain-containing protein [Acidobacteriota bacterium]